MRAKPKKRLGQVFLINQNSQNKIIESVSLKADDNVLEIGPGKGAMTRKIIPKVKSLVAVEIDKGLCEFLNDEFKGCTSVKIVHQDILKFDVRSYFGKERIKVIGNIPYYISTDIIEFILRNSDFVEEAYLMLQKEFAQRIVAQAGDSQRGSLSCFVQYYADSKILFYIKRGCFWPVPKVDSAFIRLKVRREPAVLVKNEEKFFKIIRTSFSQRRKTLRNSLNKITSGDKLGEFFKQYSMDLNIRPQDMSLADFANLSDFLTSH